MESVGEEQKSVWHKFALTPINKFEFMRGLSR